MKGGELLKKGFGTAWCYFFIHLLVEIVCFQILYSYFKSIPLSWLMYLIFDFTAFVPQSFFGLMIDKNPKLKLGSFGAVLMLCASVMMFAELTFIKILALILVALGNAIIHASGAVATTAVSEGRLAHSAIFVGGGSFGVIIGQTLGNMHTSLIISFFCCIVIIFLIAVSNPAWIDERRTIPQFSLIRDKTSHWAIIITAFFVVVVRSYIGYAIPISWKKEPWQAFLLFFIMGAGKVLGGILSDRFGSRRVGVLSTLLCIPFLICGNNVMLISVIGVFLFSLTMSITFGMLLSVIKNSPGLAFGITTIGLFIGIMPAFFFSLSPVINGIIIVVLSILSAMGLGKTLK